MSRFRLSRRTLLRGLGGVALGLPALEIMAPARARAQSAALPRRFVLLYGGTSQGADGNPPFVAPSVVGAGYELTRALTPIGTYGVQSDVSVVSGLKVPWDTGSGVPAAGRSVYYHFNTLGPQVSGMRGPSGRDGTPRGPTADQLVAQVNAGATPFPVLALRAQAVDYDGNTITLSSDLALSWRATSGGLQRVDPLFSPSLAFQTLFSNFTPPDPGAARQARIALQRRQSVLDLVDGSLQRLLPRLGTADQQRLDQHLTELRALEARVAMTQIPAGTCQVPTNPGADPPIQTGYSGEELRAEVLTDLVAMALACDLTRSVSFMLTQWKCYMNVQQITGYPTDMHSLTHQSSVPGVADSVGWHLKHLCRLVQKLGQLPDGSGSILDNTALVLLFEGGSGYDPEGGSSDGAHSTENMCAFIAGRAGGLKPGKHVVASGAHPASVVLSAMNAVGYSGGLGEVPNGLSELFV
jgi:hypothetical protein